VKRCSACREFKGEGEFYDGRHRCMQCMRADSAERYKRNPEPARRRARERKARMRQAEVRS
jgi:hypothetical protein